MSEMRWVATERIPGLTPAPGGLAFVQDLLNSCSDGRQGARHRHEDLFSDIDSARNWVREAGQALGKARGVDLSPPDLPETDLADLIGLRNELRLLVSGHTDDDDMESLPRLRSAQVTVAAISGPAFAALPRGRGWRWVASAVLAECFQAQQDGSWRRLKVCRNTACVAAFYDRTRNNSGVWHSVRSCGNPANLRASRARKRASQA
ncbi:CGNR zinc finger domain-containing protein [Streptomyces sp. NBC_00588]|uniref:CGNR zinc finger domain-containing protein n=1 Tax=Streptomyces sp. NBC_00588 TaxID=2975784 RepID=UPI003FCD97D3